MGMFKDNESRIAAARRLGLEGVPTADELWMYGLEQMRKDVLTEMGLPLDASPATVLERADRQTHWAWYDQVMAIHGSARPDGQKHDVMVRYVARSRAFVGTGGHNRGSCDCDGCI